MDRKWRSVSDRYQTDSAFHALVDMLQAQLHGGNYTPTELREAVMLAATLYENTHIRPLIFTKQELGL